MTQFATAAMIAATTIKAEILIEYALPAAAAAYIAVALLREARLCFGR